MIWFGKGSVASEGHKRKQVQLKKKIQKSQWKWKHQQFHCSWTFLPYVAGNTTWPCIVGVEELGVQQVERENLGRDMGAERDHGCGCGCRCQWGECQRSWSNRMGQKNPIVVTTWDSPRGRRGALQGRSWDWPGRLKFRRGLRFQRLEEDRENVEYRKPCLFQ